VPVPPSVFEAVVELGPREDRDLDAAVFTGFGADRLRTAINRACKAAGVPAFSPHALRHRRATLWHLAGTRSLRPQRGSDTRRRSTSKTYAHATLADRRELDHAAILAELITRTGARASGVACANSMEVLAISIAAVGLVVAGWTARINLDSLELTRDIQRNATRERERVDAQYRLMRMHELLDVLAPLEIARVQMDGDLYTARQQWMRTLLAAASLR
jgi:hypothetical protein